VLAVLQIPLPNRRELGARLCRHLKCREGCINDRRRPNVHRRYFDAKQRWLSELCLTLPNAALYQQQTAVQHTSQYTSGNLNPLQSTPGVDDPYTCSAGQTSSLRMVRMRSAPVFVGIVCVAANLNVALSADVRGNEKPASRRLAPLSVNVSDHHSHHIVRRSIP
jgi:hypothetical protein